MSQGILYLFQNLFLFGPSLQRRTIFSFLYLAVRKLFFLFFFKCLPFSIWVKILRIQICVPITKELVSVRLLINFLRLRKIRTSELVQLLLQMLWGQMLDDRADLWLERNMWRRRSLWRRHMLKHMNLTQRLINTCYFHWFRWLV